LRVWTNSKTTTRTSASRKFSLADAVRRSIDKANAGEFRTAEEVRAAFEEHRPPHAFDGEAIDK
jgi:hypothetical protein